jgi:hypothetical protein
MSYVAKIGRKTTSTAISFSASADDHSRPADRGRYGGVVKYILRVVRSRRFFQ